LLSSALLAIAAWPSSLYIRGLLRTGQRRRTRPTTLALSEILTLLVYVHWSHYRTCKHDSAEYVMAHLHPYFPHFVGYQRFVELIPRAMVEMTLCVGTSASMRLSVFAGDWLANEAESHGISASICEPQTASN
jgi:hypothetical protein